MAGTTQQRAVQSEKPLVKGFRYEPIALAYRSLIVVEVEMDSASTAVADPATTIATYVSIKSTIKTL